MDVEMLDWPKIPITVNGLESLQVVGWPDVGTVRRRVVVTPITTLIVPPGYAR